MAETTISWADFTFNPWLGCTKVSPACDGCYAEAMMGEAGRYKRVIWGAPGKGDGTRVRTVDSNWAKPRKWNREAAAKVAAWEQGPSFPQVLAVHREPPSGPRPSTFVFCASLADVFDNAVPAEWRRDLFALIRETPNLTWLLLTKRPGMIVRLVAEAMGTPGDPAGCWHWWPRNAAIGCTVVNQEEADRDVPKLLAAKAALNPAFAFLSMEPLLGAVDIAQYLRPKGVGAVSTGDATAPLYLQPACDWIITGGETDQGAHKARPADPAWFRSLRDQCAAAGVPFHFKQWGEWMPGECAPPISGRQVGAYFDEGDAPTFDHFTAHEAGELTAENEPAVWRVGKRHDPCTLDGVRHDARPTPA